ncbi:AraC family transcriptional regulator [Tunturibacter empetritectus]|uniref:AraC-like DNA-binding protein n=1 Tax=Tunturiibacter lichenicola TaxID=2051959 RepID=A0A7W8J669_9BACT|nr:AraC family transcriptional regulator [Edaphobacter lichenicola]MBB5343372.1 AraC-like DNA-binding protein [Edaphobacter lichenicola]
MNLSQQHYFSVSRKDRAWGLYLTGTGRIIVRPRQPYPPPGHPAGYDFDWKRGRILDEFILLFITAGSGSFESARDGKVQVEAGNLLLVNPGEWHRYRPDISAGWTEYWATFDGEMARLWRKEGLLPATSMLRGCAESVVHLFVDLLAAADHDARSTPFLAGLCHAIVAQAASFKPSHPEFVEDETQRLRDAADFLRRHFGSVNSSSLALSCGMACSTFRRKFRSYFGVSPQRYAREQQVARAKRMLIETSMPIKAIAAELNFSSEFYFMRTFKQIAGLTPGGWRRQSFQAPRNQDN